MKIVAIDFETANNSPASVCSVGVSVMEDGVIEDSYYSLIRPEDNVSYFSGWNIRIHGIKPKDVENAPPFSEVYRDLLRLFEGAVITAHNARFDIGCLKAACQNCNLPIPDIRYFDTVEMSRKCYPELDHHRLNDMCDYLHVELDHHNAMSDAYGCMMIVVNVMNAFNAYEIEDLLKKTHVRMYRI